jgi:hypothetical protein
MTPPPEAASDDWTELSQAWAQPRADEPPLDADFIHALKRRDRLARLNFAAEIGGGVMVVGAMGWALWRGMPLPVAAAALAFALFAIGMTLWSRRGDPGLLTETPEAVLRSAVGQARMGYRWAVAGVAISLAAVLFLGAMAASGDRIELIGPYIAAGAIFILACIGFYWRHARRCRRRMAAHQAALDALGEREAAQPDVRS